MKLCSRCCILGWPLAAAPSSTSSQRKLIVLHTKSRLGLRLRSREAPFCNPDLNFFFRRDFFLLWSARVGKPQCWKTPGKMGFCRSLGRFSNAVVVLVHKYCKNLCHYSLYILLPSWIGKKAGWHLEKVCSTFKKCKSYCLMENTHKTSRTRSQDIYEVEKNEKKLKHETSSAQPLQDTPG